MWYNAVIQFYNDGLIINVFFVCFAFYRKELNRFQQEIPKLPGKRNRLDTKLHQMRIDEFVSSLFLLVFVKRVQHLSK